MTPITTSRWSNPLIIESDTDLPNNYKQQLLTGEISVLVLRNQVDKSILNQLLNEVKTRHEHVKTSSYNNCALTTFGTYLARHINEPKNYFQAYQEIKPSLPPTADKITGLAYKKLAEILNLESLEVAIDPIHQSYSPYILRIHANGVANPLHNDMIIRDAKGTGLKVEYLASQLSCIVCIQECDQGGYLKHYDKVWHQDDEVYKIKDGLGYQQEVVTGHQSCTFKPQVGDIYVINPTYYHEIDQVQGNDRVTLGFFFGFMDDCENKAIAWS